MKRILSLLLVLQTLLSGETIELLDLDIISYEQFIHDDPATIKQLQTALLEKGIVGIKGVPGYKERVEAYIDAARLFSALPEETKEKYAPNREAGDLFLGYEKGKEKFKTEDGKWVVDDLKVSYYAFVPDTTVNKWPEELELKTPYEALGMLMSNTAEAVMQKINLIGPTTLDGIPRVGRMLYYRKNIEGASDNPLWCGAHFDHGLFTALIPAVYFENGTKIDEPMEAGLFVRTHSDGIYKKVVANDPDLMLFQVGEFGQLVTNDAIQATEHRVQRANSGSIERYGMALFFDMDMDSEINSTSVLTKDARYGDGPTCSYRRWSEESFKRYIVQ